MDVSCLSCPYKPQHRIRKAWKCRSSQRQVPGTEITLVLPQRPAPLTSPPVCKAQTRLFHSAWAQRPSGRLSSLQEHGPTALGQGEGHGFPSPGPAHVPCPFDSSSDDGKMGPFQVHILTALTVAAWPWASCFSCCLLGPYSSLAAVTIVATSNELGRTERSCVCKHT